MGPSRCPFKIDCYGYKLLYVSLMVTTKQKPRADILRRKKFKHTTREVIQSQGKRVKVE